MRIRMPRLPFASPQSNQSLPWFSISISSAVSNDSATWTRRSWLDCRICLHWYGLCCLQTGITKTRLYNVDRIKPHFYIVKLGFTGVYISFLISAQKDRLLYSLEPPCRGGSLRGGSNENPQCMSWAEIWKISEFFYLNFFIFGW